MAGSQYDGFWGEPAAKYSLAGVFHVLYHTGQHCLSCTVCKAHKLAVNRRINNFMCSRNMRQVSQLYHLGFLASILIDLVFHNLIWP